jgi:putative acetyltransferase
MDTITITSERPDTPDATQLITELEEFLAPLYPQASRHGLSVERLIQENVAFFVLRVNAEPAACGGLKVYGSEYGELKRMFVRPQFRGTGLAKRMLLHLEAYAREQGLAVLRLETGIYQIEAIGLYQHMGYQTIPPFGAYVADPYNLFFEKKI